MIAIDYLIEICKFYVYILYIYMISHKKKKLFSCHFIFNYSLWCGRGGGKRFLALSGVLWFRVKC